DGVVTQSPPSQVLSGAQSNRAPVQTRVEGLRAFENGVQATGAILYFWFAFFRQRDTRHRRKHAQRFAKLEVLALHQPIERRAPFAAAEAVPRLRLRAHIKR